MFSPSGRTASAAASGVTGGHTPHAAVSPVHFDSSRPQSSGGNGSGSGAPRAGAVDVRRRRHLCSPEPLTFADSSSLDFVSFPSLSISFSLSLSLSPEHCVAVDKIVLHVLSDVSVSHARLSIYINSDTLSSFDFSLNIANEFSTPTYSLSYVACLLHL